MSKDKDLGFQRSPRPEQSDNLQRSLIGREYQPIRGLGQPFWVCGRDTGDFRSSTIGAEWRTLPWWSRIPASPYASTLLLERT
jgi:hypothetical protein